MSNEELILQELKTIKQDVGIVKEKYEKHDKDIERLEKTTDTIAVAVVNMESGIQFLKEKAEKHDQMDNQLDKVQNTLDYLVKMYETDHQERLLMNNKITDLEKERIEPLEENVATIKIKLSIA